MDEGVHPSGGETWLASCVADEDRSLGAKDDTGATYTQLKTVCHSAMGVLKSSVDGDIVSMEQSGAGAKNTRPHSTPATLLWLEENYETADGVCIPRSTLYMHYVDFCDRHCMQPVNAASFGKIIRQQFPHLTTRRLGTRGQSRYHYYGIAVKECSPYYEVSYSKRGCSSLHESKKESLKQPTTYSQRTKIATLLPDFTNFKDLHLPPNVPEEKVSTFLMMYRTHCQRILDTVIRANFDEVNSFLQHFWRGMPSHIASILNSNAIVSMIGVCDSFVYKAISNVLFTSVLQALPDSLIQVVRKFSKDLLLWLRSALESIPENLRALKFDLAKYFSRTLRRQTSLNHLCQASRMVIHNADITAQMLQDWRHVDLDGISRQILFTVDGHDTSGGATIELITSLYKEFETLLEDQAPIEAFVEWLESLVDRCVVQPNRKRKNSVRRLARQFLLMWSSFGARVIRDMTLHSAPSFGSFHLLHLTFDDYILFLVEQIHWEERTQELFANIPTDTLPNLSDSMLDDSLVDSEIGMNKLKWGYGGPQALCGEVVPGMLGAAVLQLPSPSSSHSHASSNNNSDVIGQQQQHSPVQHVLDPHPSDMNDDPNPESANDARHMEYSIEQPDHYSSSAYHYNGHVDVRSTGYNGYSGATAAANMVHRQEARAYSCHAATGHPYVMSQTTVDEQHHQQQQSECSSGLRGGGGGGSGVGGPTVRGANGEPLGNGLDYSNTFVQYGSVGSTSVRRGDYGPPVTPDCHATYATYDQQQQQQQQQQTSPALIYAPPSSSCYYPAPLPPPPPYEPSPGASGCCSPAPSYVRPDTPNKNGGGGGSSNDAGTETDGGLYGQQHSPGNHGRR